MEYSQWGETFRQTGEQLLARFNAYLPNFLTALAFLFVGWLLAQLFRALTRRLVTMGVSGLARNQSIQQALDRTGLHEQIPRFVAGMVFWLVLLFFMAVAIEQLQLNVATTIISSVTYYLPRVLLGSVIVLVGVLAGNIAYNAVTKAASTAGLGYANLLGRTTQILLLSLGVIIGAEEMGIKSNFLTAMVTIFFGTALGGAALAFGLGSGLAISNIVSAHYLLRIYQVGQTIRIGGMQGRIVAINQTGVVLDGVEGQILVPGRKFSEETSLLVKGEN